MQGQQSYSYSTADAHSRNQPETCSNDNHGSSPANNDLRLLPAGAVPASRPGSLNDFRIVIICALKTEYDAVDALFEEVWDREEAFRPRHPDNNTYTFGRLGGKAVALVNLPSMGQISAAGVASHLKISLPNVEIAFLVGLCAGAPEDGKGNVISMADVIIGTQVIQEDYGRLHDAGFERKTDVEDILGRLPPRVRGWLVQRSGRRPLKELKDYTQSLLSQAFEDSEIARDFAFPGQISNEPFPSTRNLQIFFGRIGSSNHTLRSQARRDQMIMRDGILGFEMESAGIWDHLPTVVVKAVCDYGDQQKSKEWQGFAALTAAACTKALIRDWVLQVQDWSSTGNLIKPSHTQLDSSTAMPCTIVRSTHVRSPSLESTGERQMACDKTLSMNHAKSIATRPHGTSREDAGDPKIMNAAFWPFAWIYAFLNLLLRQPSSQSATSAAHNAEQDFASDAIALRDIEDAIAGVKKVVTIFRDETAFVDGAGSACSRLYVELFIMVEWLDENVAGFGDGQSSTLLQEVESVLNAVERLVQDQPHESRHKYPKLRLLALCEYQSRSYKREKARVLKRLQSLLEVDVTALKDFERQVSTFTTSRRIASSSVEATPQPVRTKPAGHSSMIKKAIHRIIHGSIRCACTSDLPQSSSHLLQVLLEPIAAANPETMPRIELLISSRPIEHRQPVGNSKEKILGHWRDVFITCSSAKSDPTKHVRWIDRAQVLRSEVECNEEIVINDHALCGIISGGTVHQRWGVQIAGDQFFRTRKPLPVQKRVQPYHGIPLGSVLGLLNDKTRACLAYILAQSLWQFYDCDLTGMRWTCDNIKLMWQYEGPQTGDLRLYSSMPYLACQSLSHDSYVEECLHVGTKCDAIHGYPRVVALGILLLEIGMGKEVELSEASVGDPIAGATRDEIWDYAQEQARLPWPNLNFPNYWRSVQKCFDVHLFDIASPCPEATAQEKERELSKRRDILYDEVVLPLEQLVYGTGWVRELGSKDHVRFPSCSYETTLG